MRSRAVASVKRVAVLRGWLGGAHVVGHIHIHEPLAVKESHGTGHVEAEGGWGMLFFFQQLR